MTDKMFTPDIIFIPTKLNGALKSEWQEIPSSPYDEIYVKRSKVEKEVIDKACEWLRTNYEDIGIRYIRGHKVEDEIESFKKAMEE